MEAQLDWTCPICGHAQDDVANVTPCLHQLCYGCALWWAKKQRRCAICGHGIRTIRYSVRSDDDYLECPAPQPTARSGYGPQGQQEPAEPVLLPPEHSFPPEIWAAFFQQHPGDLSPLFQWLHQEIRGISADRWWEMHARTSIIMNFLCKHGLDEAVLLRELQPSLRGLTVRFVRRLVIVAAALYGPQIRRQRGRGDTGPGRPTGSAGPSAEQLPGVPGGGPGNPATAAPADGEPQEEPGQAAAAGPSAQGRDRSRRGPRAAPKRKAGSSPWDSPLPRKRRPRR
ncbi:alpha-2A adrenergic receptor-like [Phasianus colchicus]|uniref:alpha-2A adrenergic receptor-like n=1 Tax=Phasianus colchicus TaxID=9054 RepID=UPI00129E9F27|nr:alpha-2A adrenergic receptor-like [Phasianus colchicus]